MMLDERNKPELIDHEKYRISSRKGILSALRRMVRNNSQGTCYFGEGESFFPTAILSLDSHRDEMVLDYGPDEEINQQALRAEKWNIVAFPDKVKIHFSCQHMGKVEFEGRNAFLAQVPASLLRMQKREYYRIATPTIAPVKCVIPMPEGMSPSVIQVILQNISCGGMAVIDPMCKGNLEQDTAYENCLITLPGVGVATVKIRIQRVKVLQMNNLKRQHASCEFIDVEENMLSMIQRYIMKLELEQKRKQ